MLTERRRKEIAALTQKKYRERAGELLVEGLRSVEAALDAGAPLVEIVGTEAALAAPRARAAAGRARVPVHVVPEAEMARLSDVETSQGLLAVARIRRLPEADLAACPSVLVLDGVQDPGNVGTVLRTAAWFGAGAVVAGPGTADLFAPKVVRAAMGGLWDVPLVQPDDLGGLLRRLREVGFHVVGADLGGEPAARWRPAERTALVLGSEAHGLSDAVRAVLDARVVVGGAPHRRGAESLNIAVAAGILLYQWLGR